MSSDEKKPMRSRSIIVQIEYDNKRQYGLETKYAYQIQRDLDGCKPAAAPAVDIDALESELQEISGRYADLDQAQKSTDFATLIDIGGQLAEYAKRLKRDKERYDEWCERNLDPEDDPRKEGR